MAACVLSSHQPPESGVKVKRVHKNAFLQHTYKHRKSSPVFGLIIFNAYQWAVGMGFYDDQIEYLFSLVLIPSVLIFSKFTRN